MRLACAGPADQHTVLGRLSKRHGGQLLDQRLVDRRGGELEARR
jgi:hypothetical protein